VMAANADSSRRDRCVTAPIVTAMDHTHLFVTKCAAAATVAAAAVAAAAAVVVKTTPNKPTTPTRKKWIMIRMNKEIMASFLPVVAICG